MGNAAETEATAERLMVFLKALAETGNVTESAKAAGVCRATAYRWRDKVPDFALAWDQAIEESVDALELEARRRAIEGAEKPIFYRGVKIATVQEPSDMLLMFLLNGNRPQKYKRQRVELTGADGGPLETRATIVQYPVNPRDESEGRDGE
jgi:transposase-like protein